MAALDAVATWPVDHAAAVVVGPDGIRATHGDVSRGYALASVTKPLIAWAVAVAIEEGALDLDTPAGPTGSTVAHLLAHTSGLAMRSAEQLAAPGNRRIYSNAGFAVLAETLEAATDMDVADYVREAVFAPLAMGDASLHGGAAAAGHGVTATAADLAAFAGELLAPSLVSPETHRAATSVAFPGLDGVLPGYGVQRPNDWGLGVEIRSAKTPHWTGRHNAPSTVGHFGQSGTFCWADPVAKVSLVVLTDRAFGSWCHDLWPDLSDAVLAEST